MLWVLAIIGVLSVGGLSGYSKMMSQYKINASLEQVGSIASKISAYGAGQDSYTGLSNDTAKKLGAPITDTNPYDGGITIKPSPIEGGNSNDTQAYVIEFSGLTEDACVTLGSSAWGNVRNSSFIGLGVGSESKASNIEKELYLGCTGENKTDYAAACSGGSKVDLPMDPGIASVSCNCPSSDCIFVMKFF
jgi:type II secretory pathway pseudopilin PulG